MLRDPRVVVRVEGTLYRGRVVRVTDPRQIEALRRSVAAKYGVAEDGWAARQEVWFFRVETPSDAS